MIIVWLIAAVSSVSLFFLLLPHGWIAALIGASLGGSFLAALAAVGIAWLRQPSRASAPPRNGARRTPSGRATIEESEGRPS